ncbi:MAG: SdrD B-like domain-containing protein [Armatimonadia bacterium]
MRSIALLLVLVSLAVAPAAFALGTTSASLGDTVWYDANANGLQDNGEQGIPNVVVTAKRYDAAGNLVYDQSKTTDATGYYLFPVISAGTYVVTTSVTNLDPTHDLDGIGTPNSAVTTLASGQARRDVDFGFVGGSIGDYVWLDSDRDANQDADEYGIPGVTVNLLDADGAVLATTETDDNGLYTFTGLKAGDYSVQVDYATISPADLELSYDLDGIGTANIAAASLGIGEDRTDVDFGYKPLLLGSIGDYVWLDADRDSEQDADECGIPNVTVSLLDSAGAVITTTTTDANGLYTFGDLKAGDYSVQVDYSTISPADLELSYDLDGIGTANIAAASLAAGENRTDVDFGYKPAPVLSGSLGDYVWLDADADGVQDANESGLPNVTVTLLAADGSVLATTTTDANGLYTFGGLAAGSYSVQVDAATIPANVKPTYDLDGAGSANIAAATLAAAENRTDVDFGYTGTKPGIDLEKTGPATANRGDTITYHFKVTNTGNTWLYGGVTVNDPMLGGNIWHKTPVAPGEVNEFDITYSIPLTGSLTAGTPGAVTDVQTLCVTPPTPTLEKIVNTATATGCPPGLPNVTDTSTWTTTISTASTPKTPGVKIEKTGPATAKRGDTITYHFKVTNTGNVTLNGGVTVKDPMLGGNIWSKGSVAPGEVNEFDKTYAIPADDGSDDDDRSSCRTSCDRDSGSNSSWRFGARPLCSTGQQGRDNDRYDNDRHDRDNDRCDNDRGDDNCSGETTLVNVATVTGWATGFADVTDTDTWTVKIAAVDTWPFTTYTQGGWGAKPSGNNPGKLLHNNFEDVYPDGLVIGSLNTLTFTSAQAITDFLPSGGTAGTLWKKSYTNPTGKTEAGVFAGQVLAMRLGVDFSDAGVTRTGLGSLKVAKGTFKGWTVNALLNLCERVLGGDSAGVPYTVSTLNDAATSFNENYDNGTTDNGFLAAK